MYCGDGVVWLVPNTTDLEYISVFCGSWYLCNYGDMKVEVSANLWFQLASILASLQQNTYSWNVAYELMTMIGFSYMRLYTSHL